MATNAETLANDCYLAVFKHLVEHRVKLLSHRLVVYLLVGAGVIAAWHDVKHTVVLTVLERSIDAHMVTICHEALSDLLLVNLGGISKLRHRGVTLVLLLKLVDLVVNLVERAYLVEGQTHNAALLGNGLQDALANPPHSV